MTERAALAFAALVSRLVPPERRAEWLREWRSELRFAAGRRTRPGPLRLALGALPDALALRWGGNRAVETESAGGPRVRPGRGGGVEMVLRELRFAIRNLIRNPGFTSVGVGTLALGLGAAAAIFAVVQGVVLAPLPYPDADRLVSIFHPLEGGEATGEWPLTRHTYLLFRDENRTFEAMGAYQPVGANLAGSDGTTQEAAALATPGLWSMLGARPAAGRLLTEADSRPGAPPVAVLGHELWQSRFGGDPGVVGRTVRIDGDATEIVGVASDGLRLPHEPIGGQREGNVDLWLPYELDPSAPVTDMFRLRTIARLEPGVDPAPAQAELDRLTRRLTEEYPGIFSPRMVEQLGFQTRLRPLRRSLLGGIEGPLWIIFGAVGLVLLIACANVANLFLVRTEGRRGEVSVRAALGAGRRDLAVHFLAESLLLAAVAGGVGLLLAQGGIAVLLSLAPSDIPRLDRVALGWETVAFTGVLVALVTLFLGAYPVLRFGVRPSTSELGGRSAGEAGRSGSFVRDALVVGQVATALVLMVASGMLMASFRELARVDPGFEPSGVLALEVALPGERYSSPPETVVLWRRALERIRALPGVGGAAIGPVPLEAGASCSGMILEDQGFDPRNPREGLECAKIPVLTSAGYLDVMGIELVEGRMLEPRDTDARTGAVLITRTMADRIWPGESPLGKGLKPAYHRGSPFYRVVGVVEPIRAEGLDQSPSEIVFTPLLALEGQPDWNATSTNLLVKTDADRATTLAPTVRRILAELEPEAAVGRVRTMSEVTGRAMIHITFPMFLLGIAAAAALVLGTVGLYGVVAHRVGTRRAELGIRMALGATAFRVKRLVFGQALRLGVVGLVLGLVASLFLNRTLRSLLFGVAPNDPLAMGGAAGLLLLTTALAAYLPARRATEVDPASSLRAE